MPSHPTSTLRVAVLSVTAGIAAGLVGAGLNLLIESLSGLAGLSIATRLWVAGGVGLACALAWWWLRPLASVTTSLSVGTPLPLGRTLLDALAQIFFVGAGASLGREQAPRQVAAAVGLRLAAGVDPALRARIAAGAAGAGLAAVYNVPIAGAVFALETLPLKRDKSFVAIAFAMSAIATIVARPITGSTPYYLLEPGALDQLSSLAAAGSTRALVGQLLEQGVHLVVIVAACAIIGAGFRRVLLHRLRIPSLWMLLSVPGVLVCTVLVDLRVGEVAGNGQVILESLFHHPGPWQGLAVLLLAKLVMTWLAISSGAAGGVLTPSLAIGGLVGALVTVGLNACWVALGISATMLALPAAVVLGGIGVLAITQRAPLFAIAFGLELIHAPAWLILPAVAVGMAAYLATKRIR